MIAATSRSPQCSTLLAVVCMLTCPSIAWGDAAERVESPRPNIVYVLVDDLRWDDLGCMGHPFVKTPHIDRIAREGALFRNAFCTTPLCSPSRGSILTGQYAHKHGITDNTNRSARSHRLVTFPLLLNRAGYESAFIGKWHMGNDDTRRPGFDHWVSLKGQGESRDPILNENGKRGKVAGYTTDILTDRAVRFVRRKREAPFLIFMAQKALHPNTIQYDDGSISDPAASHFIPAERHKTMYADAAIQRRLNATDSLEGKPTLARKIGDLPPLSTKTGSDDKTIRDRLRMLMAVDEGVGRIYEAIEETGQLDNTVFIVTSDHGYFYGEHGLSVERRLAYEETLRIPLLVRYPKLVVAGRKIDFTTLSIDVAPTLLELGRAARPDSLHGRSLVPLLAGQTVPPRRSFLVEYYSDTVFPRIFKMGYKAVRTDRWKYIHYLDLGGMDELYDLQADPYELQNLIGKPESRSVLQRLRDELSRLLEETR